MTEDSAYRARTFENRSMALGLAVEYLMKKPAFARLPFGHWARVITGQIRRGHYVFITTEKNVVGFLGWAVMTEAEAEAWVVGAPGATEITGTSGDCVALNAWAADTPEVNQMLFDEALERAKGFRMLYAKREYANGGSRPLRLRIKDAVAANAATAGARRQI
jgi:hemolysin-activating ACP:hemolysin acyltransferase